MSVEALDLYAQRPEQFDPLANHPDSESLILESLNQSSLLAGRERPFNWELDDYMSEGALHRYRAVVDVEALIHLAENGPYDIPLSSDEKDKLREIYDVNFFDSETVARIDHIGYNGNPALEHDVKAVEVYVAEEMDNAGLSHLKQWLHYGETSEDQNNLAYNLMLRDATNDVLVPAVTRVADRLAHFAATHADTPLLGVTHAQNASPQTVGKRLGKSLYGLTEVVGELQEVTLTGKYGGAVGNHNPLVELNPDFDWNEYSKSFVESFGFKYSAVEDQRNNHLAVTRLLGTVSRIALVSHQTVQNVWLNIRDNILVQTRVEGEVGSSTMSHKINPWRLENAEALFEQAQNLIQGASSGLVESRDERDLSDHDWQRAYGDMFGRVVAGLNYTTTQLDRITVDETRARATLDGAAEVLSELLQTAGRSLGDPEAYKTAMTETQGKKVSLEEMREIIGRVLPDGAVKDRVMTITPDQYVGLAPQKAREAVLGWHACKTAISNGILDWRHGIDGVLFDLDDTLVMGDKQELAARMSAIAEDLQADISPEDMAVILKTNGWTATIDAFVKAHNDKHGDQLLSTDLFGASNKKISGSFDHMLTLADDVDILLDNLDSKGKKKAIVTQRGPASLPRVLQYHNLARRFDATVHGSEAKLGKPYPEGLTIALAKLGIGAERAMMVGDRQDNDVMPANALGMTSVLVRDGDADPTSAKPTIHVRNLRELALKFER